MHLERKLFVVSVALFLILVGISAVAKRDPRAPGALSSASDDVMTLGIGSSEVRAAVADDDAERSRGLGGRRDLAGDEGMLFVFDTSDLWGIWMKDMEMSIDVIWLDSSGKVVHIEEGMTPETYPKIFFPAARSRYVIELPAGKVEESGVRLGDVIPIGERE